MYLFSLRLNNNYDTIIAVTKLIFMEVMMDILIRFAEKEELRKVNMIRKQVNDLHVNGRPDIFREG